MTQIIADNLRVDEVLEIHQHKKPKNIVPPFRAYGTHGMTYQNIEGLDVAPIVKDLSKAANHLFWETVERMNTLTNVRIIRGASLSPSEKVKLSKAFTELKSVDLMKRVKREHYMINPKAVISFKGYEQAQENWDKLP